MPFMVAAPWNPPAGLEWVLDRWQKSDWVRPCFAADRTQEKAPAMRAPLPDWLDRGIAQALTKRGVSELYAHQARALEIARARRSFVVATPTASGKSVCFHVPVLQALRDDPDARALYIYPTKALARDQEAALIETMKDAGIETSAVVYDGDTPADARRAARERSRIVITNPDMLHAGILPHHASWARTFQRLRYVVLDELHTYRGVFGSHVANVLRRLRRIARFHGSDPIFIGATATIGNPGEHASRLFGLPSVDEVLESGAPRGERRMFLFNPPVVNAELGIRASYVKQAVMLAKDLVRAQVPTIVFGHSRNDVEIMLRYLRAEVKDDVAEDRIMAYRGGYLPAMRRDIERRLREGEILGVVATNALELGIDIGSLDAVICAGYPGSVAATWQRFGRAGRRGSQSVCVLVTSSAPLDQYLAREPEFVLGGKNIEEARIDPDNVEILVQHVKCAAFEAPFARGDAFGAMGAGDTEAALGFLEKHGVVHATGGTWHWAADSYPANNVSLRSVGWHNVVVVDVETDRSFAEMDWRAAHTMLHDRAIYQHDGETWQVERFDYENNKAFVRKVKPDYFTTAMTNKKLSVIEIAKSEEPFSWGEVSLVEKVVGYKKIKFHTHENAGYGEVMLPEMQMHTTAFWMTVPDARTKIDGLRGVGHALETVATLALMCEPCDLGTSLGDQRGGALLDPTLYLHEEVPGGTGLAERIYELRATLLERTARMIESCSCTEGCPACVGPSDSKRKRTALEILRVMLPS
jgi:DEAD/DEAH box helicase domain-containing protein